MDVLYVSRPISYNEAYQAQPPGAVRVSVRLAIWYLMLKGNDLPSEWQMRKDDSVQNTSGLRSADASGGGGGRSGLPSHLGGSGSSAAEQPSSGGSFGTTYSRSISHAPPKPLTSDQWKKLQPPVVVSQNILGKTEEWRMELKKGGPTKSIELRNIAQRTGPGGELAIVYSDKTGAYLLQVPNAFKAFLAQRQPSSGQQSSHLMDNARRCRRHGHLHRASRAPTLMANARGRRRHDHLHLASRAPTTGWYKERRQRQR
jgi:hypothetical protein